MTRFALGLTLTLTLMTGTACITTQSVAAEPKAYSLYIGTYGTEGIHHLRLDMATGKLIQASEPTAIKNPSFVAIHPNQNFLYAVGEGAGPGVTAFAIQSDGSLKQLNQQSSGGKGPCHIVVDHSGKNVLVANYGGGSVSSIPIGADGKLGKPASQIQHKGSSANKKRQAGPHAHSINVDAANKFAFVADLGLDKVLIYKFDATTGKLTPNTPASAKVKPGAGPRHFVFHPAGKFAYVINELQSTMTAFAYDASKGSLTDIQTLSTLPKGHTGRNSTAEVRVHPSGKFLYGSNRGHDSIVVYAIDQATGKLTLVEHESVLGKTPRNFNLDPTGKWLIAANMGSANIVSFKVDQATGKLSPSGHQIKVNKPVCIRMIPSK
jgi:6-phosphogluconolactonase